MPHPKLSALIFVTCLLLATAPSLRAAEPPPEPVSPERTKATTRAEYSAALDRWRDAHSEWEANLTARQYLEWKAREYSSNSYAQSVQLRERLPLPTDGYTWQAAAAERKLNTATIAVLAKDKIAYGPSVRQSFEPYLGGPVFITSDSILNAFHVLFEDSFRELELRRAARFRPDFEKLLTSARQLAATGDILAPERAAPALHHLERVLGPALVLNGTPLDFFAAANRADIQAQVDRLNAATATELPTWLAPADPASLLAIDYARCRPVGFYTAPARLAAYFRAMRWLQLVPFRANREPEFDAMVLLACASHDCRFIYGTNLMSCILGPNDDPSPVELYYAFGSTFPLRRTDFDCRLPEARTKIARELINGVYYRINTDLRAQRTLAQTFSQLTFRIIPQAALPDSVLLQQLLDHDQKPSGLAVAAMLGLPLAKIQANAPAAAVAPSIPAHPNNRTEPSLYDAYLDTLGALFRPPEPEAPAFLRSEAWTAKSTQTALAGWAQMRHTFTLQAKRSECSLGLVIVPPGFVEPNPEFFSRLSSLLARCTEILDTAHAFESDAACEADELREVLAIARQDKQTLEQRQEQSETPEQIKFAPDYNELAPEEIHRQRLDTELGAVGIRHGMKPSDEWTRERNIQCLKLLIPELEAKIARLEQGTEQAPTQNLDLRPRWRSLARIISRLEALAHKQLRGQPWTEDETAFLKSYGEQLGLVHGYFGNAWLSPRDDAPRWAEVSGLPERGKFLAAGVGRPREFYVLYPWNGMEILCVGSVMQYYEYETDQRLTDDAWRSLLDSPAAPSLPAWLLPYAPPPTAPRVGRD